MIKEYILNILFGILILIVLIFAFFLFNFMHLLPCLLSSEHWLNLYNFLYLTNVPSFIIANDLCLLIRPLFTCWGLILSSMGFVFLRLTLFLFSTLVSGSFSSKYRLDLHNLTEQLLLLSFSLILLQYFVSISLRIPTYHLASLNLMLLDIRVTLNSYFLLLFSFQWYLLSCFLSSEDRLNLDYLVYYSSLFFFTYEVKLAIIV